MGAPWTNRAAIHNRWSPICRPIPQKASAWAAAKGISVNQISTYIGGLTPMTLRYDTRVTNHGYVNGQANAIPEILQAGQAVLVDSHGVPLGPLLLRKSADAPRSG